MLLASSHTLQEVSNNLNKIMTIKVYIHIFKEFTFNIGNADSLLQGSLGLRLKNTLARFQGRILPRDH